MTLSSSQLNGLCIYEIKEGMWMSYKNQINVIQLKVLQTFLDNLLHLIRREIKAIHEKEERKENTTFLW